MAVELLVKEPETKVEKKAKVVTPDKVAKKAPDKEKKGTSQENACETDIQACCRCKENCSEKNHNQTRNKKINDCNQKDNQRDEKNNFCQENRREKVRERGRYGTQKRWRHKPQWS